jgi:RNA polymerase sigma-70 factor (ECF subfamily)
VEHHLDALHRFALSLCRDRVEADDLLQETLLKGLKGFAGFETGSNFKAWIFAIEMNAFRSRYRQRWREVPLPSDELPEPPNVGEDVFDLLLKEEVLAAVEALPEPFRAAILLVDLEGLSYREACQTLDCPAGTLMSRLHRGRGLLKTSLAGLAKERGLLAQPQGGDRELP